MAKITSFKKIVVTFLTFLTTFFISQPASADNNPFALIGDLIIGNLKPLLQQIADNTYNTLQAVNTLPNYILNWTNPDTTQPSNGLATAFSTYTSSLSALSTTQLTQATQTQLLTDFFVDSNGTPYKDTTLPNANDLTYQTLLGWPFFAQDPRNQVTAANPNPTPVNPVLNYIETASGNRIPHYSPPSASPTSWSGSKLDQQKFTAFFNAVSATETFNSFVLSQFSNPTNNTALNTAQQGLLQQATGSTWFQTVQGEAIGVVLRQILMYDSQIFVLFTQLLQNQSQQLTAQVMTNTLLVLLNMQNENLLYKAAIGQMKT